MSISRLVAITVVATVGLGVGTAEAIPAFSRKYKTSCITCHTIFPKLTPFGEQFRRNGFRFPGVDSDFTKADPVELGSDEQKKLFPHAVWPATLSSFPPLALGFNGQAVFHPDRGSSAGAADNHSVFNADGMIEEAHLWSGGSIDDSITFFAELTFDPDGASVEHANLHFGDLIGPAHAMNVTVGKGMATLTSFGPHSSYISDMALPMVGVTGLYGASSEPFMFTGNHNAVEVNGVLGSRIDYAVGLAAGSNLDVRNTANVYAHAGLKLGGSTLDGEHTGGVPQDLDHEHSITLDAFLYRSISRFTDAAMTTTKDTALTGGGVVRLQRGAFELDAGAYLQVDDRVYSDSKPVTTLAQWNEASWLIHPWLVAAARVDYLHESMDGGSTASSLRITPGVAALIRPNIRLSLVAPIERASGAPDAGWGAAGFAAAPSGLNDHVGPEIEAVELGLFTAF